jgi:NAD(P)-dependent dehydrogenase (short-subunit alcohol dehydrogenase family)
VATFDYQEIDYPSNMNATPPDASIVTGGGRGIGRAVTLRLARDGPVVVVGRGADDLREVCRMVAEAGGLAEPCPGDVGDPATADRARDLVISRGWSLANLICNAGAGKGGPTHEFDPALWRSIFDTNVHGSFYFVRACLPAMLERGGGTICLMSSVAGLKGVPFDAAYTASKHALVGLARSLALEYGKRGIVAVPLCPGFVESEMTQRAVSGLMKRQGLSSDEARRKIASTSPQRRILPAEELAEVIALICSGTLAAVSGNPLVLGGT